MMSSAAHSLGASLHYGVTCARKFSRLQRPLISYAVTRRPFMRAIPTASESFILKIQYRHFSRSSILPQEDFYRVEPVTQSATVESTPLQIEKRPAEELKLGDQSVDHHNIISQYQSFVS